jgi:hypothetical protein
VIDALFNFYQRPLTIDFLNELRKPSKKLDDDGNGSWTLNDSFAMPPRVLTQADAMVKYHDIMGDLLWFNGLHLESGNTYSVSLGT